MKSTIRILALGLVLAAGSTGAAFAQTAASSNSMKQESAQPGTDTWITTKVKAELMATKGIPSTDITVTTVNGNVTLSGMVDTKAQAQKAIAVAQTVKGVHKVDSTALSSRG